MSDQKEHSSASVPNHGWKVRLNHVFPEKRNQDFTPTFRVILSLLMLIIRYVLYQLWRYAHFKKPVMDYIFMVVPKQIYGVPLGGIGGGTIGRGFKGEFCRLQMRPGIYEYDIIDADQFIVTIQDSNGVTVYQNVLSPYSAPNKGHLNHWKWNFPGENASYTAIYPRSWTEYYIPEHNVKLVCRQVSPVIPHNYKDTSLPGGVLVWTIENFSSKDLYVSITLCMKGYKGSKDGELFTYIENDVKIVGAEIFNKVNGMDCTYTFGVRETTDVNVTRTTFSPNGTGLVVWDQLKEKGHFEDKFGPIKYLGEIACAVCAKTKVPVDGVKELEFSIIWHMPRLQFHDRDKVYTRYYTKHFGSDGEAGKRMCCYAITNYRLWEKSILEWQEPILTDETLPDWYKSAIFNELYFISDGGTVWVNASDKEIENFSSGDVRNEYGKFAYLEGHEYRMYNTYDVHFYASFALAHLWPKLQQSIQYEFRDTITMEDRSLWWNLYNGHIGRRKVKNCVPHDVGDPEEKPFVKIDSYPVHDVSDWKDLNLKFILQCYRDYVYMDDKVYLKDMWPQIKLLMNCCLKWDTDDDGLIENGGFPDQTYDAWIMTGVSAYCGGLWLGALYTTVEMAKILDDNETRDKFSELLKRARVEFNKKLWNGNYYMFDTKSDDSKVIMADQLCGLWYLRACNVTEEILPYENVKKALKTVFEYNVKSFKNGESGAVNGMLSNGAVDVTSVQSQEVWTGVTYAVASHLMFEGMREESFQTAKGVYETVYNRIGMAFQTPEALYETKYIRSVAYMRPLSIWAMQIALQRLKK